MFPQHPAVHGARVELELRSHKAPEANRVQGGTTADHTTSWKPAQLPRDKPGAPKPNMHTMVSTYQEYAEGHK